MFLPQEGGAETAIPLQPVQFLASLHNSQILSMQMEELHATHAWNSHGRYRQGMSSAITYDNIYVCFFYLKYVYLAFSHPSEGSQGSLQLKPKTN